LESVSVDNLTGAMS